MIYAKKDCNAPVVYFTASFDICLSSTNLVNGPTASPSEIYYRYLFESEVVILSKLSEAACIAYCKNLDMNSGRERKRQSVIEFGHKLDELTADCLK